MKRGTGIREARIKRVTEYLMNRLLPLPCGSRLPGFRTIMEETGTGRLTVAHAVRELVRQGFLRVRRDRGIFRTKPDERSDEIRLLHWSLCSLDGPGFVKTLFSTLTDLAAAEGRLLTVENVRRRSWEKVAEELTAHGISRVIVYGATIPDFAEYLSKQMEVCLELLPRHSERVTTELRGSPEMAQIQLTYLFNRGYRRIGYLHSGSGNIYQYPVHTMRLMDYYRMMAEHGFPVNPAWVVHCRERYENLEESLEKMWDSPPRPEALIVPGITALRLLAAWCRRHRIRIGEDLAVFCGDDVDLELFPEMTTVTNNPAEIGQTFWQMFTAAERGERVDSRFTSLRIRTGSTVPTRKPE